MLPLEVQDFLFKEQGNQLPGFVPQKDLARQALEGTGLPYMQPPAETEFLKNNPLIMASLTGAAAAEPTPIGEMALLAVLGGLGAQAGQEALKSVQFPGGDVLQGPTQVSPEDLQQLALEQMPAGRFVQQLLESFKSPPLEQQEFRVPGIEPQQVPTDIPGTSIDQVQPSPVIRQEEDIKFNEFPVEKNDYVFHASNKDLSELDEGTFFGNLSEAKDFLKAQEGKFIYVAKKADVEKTNADEIDDNVDPFGRAWVEQGIAIKSKNKVVPLNKIETDKFGTNVETKLKEFLKSQTKQEGEIFDETTTGIDQFDSTFGSHGEEFLEHLGQTRKEYFAENKGLKSELVKISPEEYIKTAARGQWDVMREESKEQFKNFEGFLKYVRSGRVQKEKLDALRDKVKKGQKLSSLSLEYDKDGLRNQEGFHRALLAEEMKIKEIPVLIINNTR